MSSPSPDVVATVCPRRFPLPGTGLAMPYCSNRSLGTTPQPSVRRGVIVIHGTGRNGPGYARYVLDAATTALRSGETIVVAPHFLTEDDVNARAPGATVPFWTGNGWKQGDDSRSTTANPRPSTISSFAVVDQIAAHLSNAAIFPNLESVVIAGHSAGGQFVNRYAAAHTATRPTRFVVANPASYLYLDRRRPVPGTLDQFATPNTDCQTFNTYKYGLDGLNQYLQGVGAANIRARYQQREVRYLLGTADNDPNDPELDQDSCERKLQGPHRLAIGTAYVNYLQLLYGPGIFATQRRVTVDGVGHTARGMFTAPEGVAELFPDAAWLSVQARAQAASINPRHGLRVVLDRDGVGVRSWLEFDRRDALVFRV